MKLSKTQATVIALLNILIVALLAVIFLVPIVRDNVAASGNGGNDGKTDVPPVDTDDDPPEHNKLRAPSAGATDEIARETRLMGDGDETIVATYFTDDVIYIFGNATVAGLDFDGNGGFLCRMSAAGTILSYTYFDGSITAACTLGSTYAVAAGGTVYAVDGAGNAVARLGVDGVVDLFGKDGNKLAVISQPSPTSLKYAEYSMVGEEWTSGFVTRIDSGYTLKYFDCYDFGGTAVIAARAHSLPLYDSIVFYKFMPGGDATAMYYGGSGENKLRPYAVMPSSFGYFALVASGGGIATIMSVDYGFTSYHSFSLGFTFIDARALYIGGKYYASFDRSDGAVTYEIEGDLSRRRLNAADGVFIDCGLGSGGASVLVGTAPEVLSTGDRTATTAYVVSVHTEKILPLDMTGARFCGARYYGGELTLVLSATGGTALSKPTAGRDVYVITINN